MEGKKEKDTKTSILPLEKFPDIVGDQSCLRPTSLDFTGWVDVYHLSLSLMKTRILASLGTVVYQISQIVCDTLITLYIVSMPLQCFPLRTSAWVALI